MSGREVPQGPPDDDLVFRLLARAISDKRPRKVAVLGTGAEAAASQLARLLGGCLVVGLACSEEGEGRDGGRQAGAYDAAVCVESMPTHQMPVVPSESPETYRRGPNWGAWRRAEDGAVRQVARRLGAARRLVPEGGTVLLRELLPNVSSALCLARLACEAGLRCAGWAHVHLHAAAGRVPDGRDGPVLVAEASPGPVAFREEEALAGLLPPLWKFTLHRLPRAGCGGRLERTGIEAALYHELVSGQARELVVRGRRSGGPFCQCFGVVERQLAYLYYADTRDSRRLAVADLLLAGALFSAALEALKTDWLQGKAQDLHPDISLLPGALARLLTEAQNGPRRMGGGP